MAKKLNINKAVKKATKDVSKATTTAAKVVEKEVVKPIAKEVVQPAAKVIEKEVVKPIAKEVIQPAAKVIEKQVVKPIAKEVVQPAAKVIEKQVVKPAAKVIQKQVVKPAAKALAPVSKPVSKKVAPKRSTRQPAPAPKQDEFKAKFEECNTNSQMQRTEITNLKYRITTTEDDKKNLLSQVNQLNGTITNLNNTIDGLNKQVNTMDNRINAPLVMGTEGFSGRIVEGFPKNPREVERDDPYLNYDIKRSGLAAVANEYKSLYGDYYAGYQDGETMIQDVLIPQTEYLAATDLTGMEYAYTALTQQNKTLEAQMKETTDEYSTDFQKAKYVEMDTTSVKKRNAIMFFLFYILVFAFAYAIFTGDNQYSIGIKIAIIVVALFYPYWIAYFSKITSFLFNYFIALFRGKPYESSLDSTYR